MLHSYRLRAEYEGLDPDTMISLPPDSAEFVVGKAFQDAPDGVLALDDENAEDLPRIHALESYFAVERIGADQPDAPGVPGVAPPYEPPPERDLDDLKRDELDALAASKGVEEPEQLPNKQAVIDAIKATETPEA